MIRYNPKSRRHFLIGAGNFALALPFLSSLVPEPAWAGLGRKKFVSLIMKYGERRDHWEPGLKPVQAGTDFRTRDLVDYKSSSLNQVITSDFNDLLGKMTFIKGLDLPLTRGHNAGDAPLGNFDPNNPWNTVDQVVAGSSSFYNNEIPAISSLVVGDSSPSFRWVGSSYVNIPSYWEPDVLFRRIFFSTSSSDKTRNVKVVDRVLANYQKARSSSRLSREDKIKMDGFLDLLNQTENRIKLQRKLEATQPGSPPVYVPTSTKDRFRVLNDLTVLALKAEATQVVTMAINRIPYLNEPDGFANTAGLDGRGVWHEDSHLGDGLTETNGNDDERKMNRNILTYNLWHAKNVILDLVKKMDAEVEANGKTMLDNSIVLWGNEMALGTHSNNNQPVVLFGSGGGTFKPGRYLDYCRYDIPANSPAGPWFDDVRPGRQYNQLLISIMQSLGLTPADYERAGQSGYGTTRSASAERNKLYEAVVAQANQMLPRFKA